MIALWLASCTPKGPPGSGQEPVAPYGAPDPAVAGVQSPVLRAILAEHWAATMQRFPEWASNLGEHKYDDRLTDPTEGALSAWLRQEGDWATRLDSLPDSMLTSADRTTRDLLLGELRADIAVSVCRFEQWSLSARDNALVDANTLADDAVIKTPEDGAHLVTRFRTLPRVIDVKIENLRTGLAAGRVENAESLSKVVEMLDQELATPLDQSAMLAPARAAHADWTQDQQQSFASDLTSAVSDGIRPALTRYRDAIKGELLPKGRTGDHIGLRDLTQGDACYRAVIHQQTTLDQSPAELHQIGLDELDKIHAEFRALGPAVLGTDDLKQIFARLRTDPSLHFATAAEVKDKAEDALKRAIAAVPSWFGRVPKAPCVVDVVPAYLAPYTTIAYYQPVRPDGSRPGIYYVNVADPETRPRQEAEVLAFHESVPGHHLQIAVAQELGDLPAFRRYDGATAFVEGWALYSERLADEMGLYSGDLDRMGMLSFDAWRAARLVVDTGLHADGWTREQAVQFMLDNTPLAENNVKNEVDRYITTPGQALAYKTGQLEIRRLRAEAEKQLGPRFDIKQFHDVVLGGGAVSLPVLRKRVEDWIARSNEVGG